ncbi:MAG TPA: amidohydrolase [Thermoanaerobaculia bacterium]|nr:amidohydrolase [Thermoanaerobaculia bacterium]
MHASPRRPVRRSAFGTGACVAAAPMAALLLALALAGCAPNGTAEPAADLVLLGGRIATLDPARPEAEAVAARDGEIVFVGSSADARGLIGDGTEIIELAGERVIPGFIEGHAHFYGVGQMKLQLDLTRAASWQEIVDLVADAARQAEPGEWITGRGWHQSKWSAPPPDAIQGLPRHHPLSAVSPESPVVLTHASGHASFVNAKAMELAGIDRTTPDPEGGTIVRDESGEAIGMLRETAQGLVGRARPGGFDEAEARRVIALAAEESLSKGVTSFQDAGSSFELIDLYRRMAEAGELPIRLWVMVREPNQRLAAGLAGARVIGAGDEHLTVRGIKKSIDGALGAHGAWLLESYEDLPQSAGLNTTPVDEIEEAARLALEHELQLCVHAIGDRANRETLDIFEQAFESAEVDGEELRWRIEHAQHLSPEDIPRFAELGVIASMQAVHATSDGPWVPSRIGDRRAQEGAYVWRSLLDSGAVVINGTDAPVEDVSPIASYAASVTRRMNDGEVFYPQQRMTREEALRAYTQAAAFAAFEEDRKGTIELGKLADLVVLSGDLLSAPEEELEDIEVLWTIVGGEVRYRREGGGT